MSLENVRNDCILTAWMKKQSGHSQQNSGAMELPPYLRECWSQESSTGGYIWNEQKAVGIEMPCEFPEVTDFGSVGLQSRTSGAGEEVTSSCQADVLSTNELFHTGAHFLPS
ncbi:hypothetical protein U0070_005546 [Myodes glareolus]|uniref:Uncharacterized protein n=1 Tax=Myodes glareolus TaxID=447135 RepID=A0AAW0IUN1_MYOGA